MLWMTIHCLMAAHLSMILYDHSSLTRHDCSLLATLQYQTSPVNYSQLYDSYPSQHTRGSTLLDVSHDNSYCSGRFRIFKRRFLVLQNFSSELVEDQKKIVCLELRQPKEVCLCYSSITTSRDQLGAS